MTKNKKTETEIGEEVAEEPVSVNPLEAAPNLPVTVGATEGENLPALPGGSAPLDRSDFITPKLHLVQKIGDLSVLFPHGTWILNKEIQLTKAISDPMSVIVLEHPVKFFIEHRPFDPNETTPAKAFRSVEEVTEAGLTLEWDNINNIRPTADRAARVLLLIMKPDSFEGESGFGMSIEGLGNCALASWLLVNTSYKTAARSIFTAEKLDLNGQPLYTVVWRLKSVPTKVGGYNIVAPQMTIEKRLSPELAGLVKTEFNLE